MSLFVAVLHGYEFLRNGTCVAQTFGRRVHISWHGLSPPAGATMSSITRILRVICAFGIHDPTWNTYDRDRRCSEVTNCIICELANINKLD